MQSDEPGAGPDHPAEERYTERRGRFAAEEARLERASRALSWARLAALAAAVAALLTGLVAAAAPPAWAWPAAGGALALLLALAGVHARLIRRQERWRSLARLNGEGLARRARRWGELPPAPEPPAADSGLPPFARDLSLFGPVSLARLLGTARTPVGRATVARWLLDAAAPAEARERQAAVAELAPALDFRQELELAGLAAGVPVAPGDAAADGGLRRADARRPPRDPERFLAWAEGEPWLRSRPALLGAAWLLPLAVAGLTAGAAAGAVPGAVVGLALLVNLGLSWALKDRLGALFDRVSSGADELRAYAGALAVAAEGSWSAPRLRRLGAELAAEGDTAAVWMGRLRRRVEIADARHGSFHVIAQTLLLWDLHALWLLERWQVAAGRHARRWLAALGELEALAALAALAHDEPDWAFAEIAGDDAAPVLAAQGLAHPLLAPGARVANDVTVGPPGTFLLVTGSNMSGKSTLLRALGANAVLALAGGPACARSLTLPPVRLATSVVVEDSLADGVSFFMAELLRLKQVVEAAAAAEREGGVLLYLLDEVLRGTNNRERREALRRVMAHLVARPAIGALTTHDLELTDLPEIARAAVPVHFRETVHPGGAGPDDGPRMTFDYRLRPGPATTTNALRLLAAVGLGEGQER